MMIQPSGGLEYYTEGGIGQGPGVGAIDLNNLINRGVDIAGRWFDPRYRAGTYTRTGPEGQIVYTQPSGSTTPVFTSVDATSSIGARGALQASGNIDVSTLMLFGFGLLAVVLVLQRR